MNVLSAPKQYVAAPQPFNPCERSELGPFRFLPNRKQKQSTKQRAQQTTNFSVREIKKSTYCFLFVALDKKEGVRRDATRRP
jgi:hypothetical protein